jgi:thiamine biosynthesis lipoprotein
MKKIVSILKLSTKNYFILLVLLASLSACSGELIKIAGETQGTSYHITYKSYNGENYKNEIDSVLHDFDMSLSTYKPASIISRINSNDKTAIADEYFIEVFNKSVEVAKETAGAFDITVAPIVNAWGFGFTDKASIDSTLIDSLLQFVGIEKVRLSGNKVVKSKPEIMLDCNAIAQGYSVDVISAYLESQGIKNYLVEIGGELNAKGKKNNNELWKVGIDKPLDNSSENNRELQVILQLENKSLATSGNYRKFYEKGGAKYAHSIDPKTGYPVQHNLLSVTIIADDCMSADAYATACMVMGLEKSKEFLKQHPELDAYLISSSNKEEYEIFETKGFVDLQFERKID